MTEVYGGCYFPKTRTFNYDLTQNQCNEEDGSPIHKENEKTDGSNPTPAPVEGEPIISDSFDFSGW